MPKHVLQQSNYSVEGKGVVSAPRILCRGLGTKLNCLRIMDGFPCLGFYEIWDDEKLLEKKLGKVIFYACYILHNLKRKLYLLDRNSDLFALYAFCMDAVKGSSQ